jgi:hypothetical protein
MTVEDRVTAMHLDDARCADLVLGLLPAEQRTQALDHAAGCAACAARLRAHAGAHARAAAESPGRPAAAPVPLPRPHERAWMRVVPIAAAAALAVALAAVFLRPPAFAPERAPWLPAAGEQVRTREGEIEDAHLGAGLAAYAARDLATADRELSAARTSGGPERLRRLYLAHVKLRRGDAATALELLRGVAWLDVPEPWRRDGIALLVVALRATGNAASADSIDRALRTVPPGTPFVP